MRTTLLLISIAAVLVGCGEDPSSEHATTSGGSSMPAAEVTDTVPSEPSSTGLIEPTSTMTVAPASDPTDLPGGTGGIDLLEAGHLSADGRLALAYETAPRDEVQQAICDYLFGAPDEVASTAKLDGTVTLTDGSGFLSLGGNGLGFACTYDVEGEAAYGLVLWAEATQPRGSDEAAHAVTIELPNGLVGWSGYVAGYSGDFVDDATAEQWLVQAGARVTYP